MSTMMPALPRLTRDPNRPRPRVGVVHLGLGAFHRAHQAVFTQEADPDGDWGIAAFTGRSSVPAALREQDGMYSVVTPRGDVTTIDHLVETAPGTDYGQFRRAIASQQVSVVTLTITEAGYAIDAAADRDDAQSLREGRAPTRALARLLGALEVRYKKGALGLTVVSCDNVPRNGEQVRHRLIGLAHEVDARFAHWIEDEMAFPSSVVDRITPRPGDDAVEQVAAVTGLRDHAAVLAEFYREWVIEDVSAGPLPDWGHAGVRFVRDVAAAETRKLRLLNAAHLLLALEGPPRGHRTVAEAWADGGLRSTAERLWREASPHLPDDGADNAAWLEDVRRRFADPAIEHKLGQIALNAREKLQVRILPTIDAQTAAGADASAGLGTVATWIRTQGSTLEDALLQLGWTPEPPALNQLSKLLSYN